MEFRVLGPVEAVLDGTRVDLGGRRQRAVLARLLVARGEVVAAERLLEDVWNGVPPPSAAGVLQAYVSNLRRVLEPDRQPRAPAAVLVSRPPGYALLAESDADRFGGLVETGVRVLAAGQPVDGVRVLDEGLALWRGDPYADLADEPWLRPELTRLEELRLVAREHRLTAVLEVGRPHEAVPELEELVARQPTREGLWRLLVLALYRTGRQVDALATLRRARDMLAESVGVDPGRQLRDLEAAVLAQSTDLDRTPATLITPVSGQPTSAEPTGSRRLLVGRDRPLASLAAAATAAAGGRPEVALVSGEPGIGKTWLVEAFADDLGARGWRPLWGRCHEGSGAPALWPWLQVLGGLAAFEPPPEPVRVLLCDASTGAVPDAADARFRQCEAIYRYLAEAAERLPVLLAFDDLQWADAASLQLLADAFTFAPTGRLLIIGTLRTGEGGGLVADMLGRLARRGARRITLGGLDPSAVAALVKASGVDVDPVLVRERTGGNPFFLRETLRAVGGEGPQAALAGVPDSVGDMLRHRLARLSAQAHGVLQAAAVIDHLEVELLAAVTGQPAAEVLDALDDAVLAGAVAETPGGGLRFSHDLIRETLSGDIAPLRRARLHGRTVDALERRGNVDVAVLASHAVAAGASARRAAMRWAAAAAEQAADRLAHQDAARWWREALGAYERSPDADPRQRVELLLRLIRAQLDAGDPVGARRTRNDAVRAADLVDAAELRARVLVALDGPTLWSLRQYDEVELDIVARLERELDAAPDGDSPLRCRLLATLAGELYDGGADPRCDPLSATAVAAAGRLGDARLLAFTLNGRALALARPTQADDLTEVGERLVALDREHGLPGYGLLGHQLLMSTRLLRFDVAVADQHAAAAARLLRRLALPLPAMQVNSWQASRHALEGRFDEAARLVRVISAAPIQWWGRDAMLAANEVGLRFHAGDMTGTEHLVDLVETVQPVLAHGYRLLMLAAEGRAQELADRARPPWPAIPLDWSWISNGCVRAQAAAVCGDEETRDTAYRALVPFTGCLGGLGQGYTPVDFCLGLLARARGDEDTARRHLHALEADCEREGLEWWASRARREAALAAS